MTFVRARRRDEEGVALVLALIFLTACGLAIGGLMTFSTTTSSAATAFRTGRGYDFDANAAMNAAVATIRVGTTCNSFTPAFTLNVPARALRVDCYSLSTGGSQRNDLLSVCPSSVSAPCPDNKSLLRANVVFYDSGGTGSSLQIQTWSNK